MKNTILLAFGAAVLLSACAQQEEPAMVTPEPVYDKYGNAIVAPATAQAAAMVDTDGDGVPDTPAPVPPVEPVEPTPPWQNQNQNQNTNQNQNQTQSGS